MATTLYLLNSAADAGTLPTSERSALTETTAGTYSLLAASTTAGTTAVQSSRATAASTAAQVLLLGEYASPAIAAGVTSITLAPFGLAISESNASVNWLSTRLNVYVWRPSTSAIVSQHDVDYTHTEALISTTSGAWITGAPNVVLACQAGDRVIVEVFARLTQGMATAYSVGLRFGGSDTTWTTGVTSASPASGIQFNENDIFGGGGGGGSVVVDIAGAVKQYWPSGPSFAVTKPTGLAAGDYWFVFTEIDDGNLTSVVPPSGWSLLTTAAYGSVDGGTLHAHYKIATGSEAATETFTSVGRTAALISLRVTGAGAIHKFSAQERNTGAITQFPTGGSLTTTTACELLWVAASDYRSQTSIPTWVQPTSYNSFTTHSTGDWNSLAIAKKTQAVAGTESATGAQVSTTDTIGGALSFLVAFSPAAAPTTLRRAISLIGGVRRQVLTSELGTGIKPLVLLGGILKLRATTEGTPVVFVSGKYKTLSANETLEI